LLNFSVFTKIGAVLCFPFQALGLNPEVEKASSWLSIWNSRIPSVLPSAILCKSLHEYYYNKNSLTSNGNILGLGSNPTFFALGESFLIQD
jgi:hypothetical protein